MGHTPKSGNAKQGIWQHITSIPKNGEVVAEIMKVSEIPIKELKVGDKVISALGTPGHITHISDEIDREDYTIDFAWDNGNKSILVWHFLCNHMEYVGKEDSENQL